LRFSDGKTAFFDRLAAQGANFHETTFRYNPYLNGHSALFCQKSIFSYLRCLAHCEWYFPWKAVSRFGLSRRAVCPAPEAFTASPQKNIAAVHPKT
jgi:hypothetical protein